MTGSFLTVEDVNSVVNRFGLRELWEKVDTSLIDVSGDFSDVLYDFVKVSRTASSGSYTFTFEVVNSAWTGGAYFTQVDGTYINEIGSHSNRVITFTTSYENICLYLHCSVLDDTFLFKKYYIVFDNPIPDKMSMDGFAETYIVPYTSLLNGSTGNVSVSLDGPGVYNVAYVSEMDYYYICRLEKSTFEFECTETLNRGRKNTVALGTVNGYLPGGAMVGDTQLSISVVFDGTVIPVEYDETIGDYVFELDLEEYPDLTNVRFRVLVEENNVLAKSEHKVSLTAEYLSVSTFAQLKSAVQENGTIQLTATGEYPSIDFTEDLIIDKDITILFPKTGFEWYLLYLQNHSIRVKENKTLKIKGTLIQEGPDPITFIENGNPCFIQEKNSKLELTNMGFDGLFESEYNYNGLGAVIHCETEDLTEKDTFTTEMDKCRFWFADFCSIFHAGQLTVKNCTVTQGFDNSVPGRYINVNNPLFLYQVSGDATITDCKFETFWTNWMCSNNVNARFGQCLFMCGENATVNGQGYEELQGNDTSLVFKQNKTVVDGPIQYYYPQIEACVKLEPIDSTKPYGCHACTGIDFVFKNNATVRRVE